MSFLTQRTPHLNASRPYPYGRPGHYTEFSYRVQNYYPPAPNSFADEWFANVNPDFRGGDPVFPDGFVQYDISALASPESMHSLDTPPSTPPRSDTGNPSKERPKRVSRRGPDHIPRPRNAFMIFRSELCASGKISKKIEGDHRHISITAAEIWKAYSDEQKQTYHLKAELEKLEHHRLYPNYRFTPTVRAKKPVKRKVNRNGAKDIERSREVGQLILAGKSGPELEEGGSELGRGGARRVHPFSSSSSRPPPSPVRCSHEVRGWVPHNGVPETVAVPDLILHQLVSPVAAPVPSNVLMPAGREQYTHNYTDSLPSGWDRDRYTGKPRNPMSSTLPRSSSPVLVELYENVVDRPFVTTVKA
ncbi:Specific transcriptional repressor [Mycena venus]|uniref:Specific transcriptional repressor n=1 Tax=Mycena venus TaxID=2733690 RepID=A0A8H6XGQ2_9AGAR|nr:Specific transcriptional repressor [Mycena venus]